MRFIAQEMREYMADSVSHGHEMVAAPTSSK
jgi:hypothetical protein